MCRADDVISNKHRNEVRRNNRLFAIVHALQMLPAHPKQLVIVMEGHYLTFTRGALLA